MATKEWQHAVFESEEGVKRALASLARAGVDAHHIELRSSVPLSHDVQPGGGPPLRTRVPLMAMLGGFLGGVGAFLLASLTALDYPLPTGGMPIVSLPPAGIITFEGLAIGAILFTVMTVFFECGLGHPGPPPGPLDVEVATGKVLVSVRTLDGLPSDWARGGVVVGGAARN